MKNSRRRQPLQEGLTRRSTQSLDHTVSAPRRRSGDPSTVPALMRTVLRDTKRPVRAASVVSFPRLKPSPGPVVRASNRSFGAEARSSFLNATLHTPEITQRAMECARRHIRREVLFATDQRRKGRGGGRRKQSKVRC